MKLYEVVGAGMVASVVLTLALAGAAIVVWLAMGAP